MTKSPSDPPRLRLPLYGSGRGASIRRPSVWLFMVLLVSAGPLPVSFARSAPASTTSSDSTLELLLKLTGQEDAATRRSAAVGILKAGSAEADKALLALFDKGDAPAQVAICEALAETRLHPAIFVDPLFKLAVHQEPALRNAALLALRTYHAPEVTARIHTLLQEHETRLLAERHAALMKALYECTPEVERSALLLAWLQQPFAIERATGLEIAQQALRKGASDPAVLTQARAMLEDHDEAVRQRAVLVLRTCSLREDSPRLQAMLKTPQPVAVREAIYNALGLLGDPHAIPAAVAGLDDESPSVAAEAATALGRLGEQQPAMNKALLAEAVTALLKKCNAGIDNPKLRERVIDAMAGIGDPHFLPALARHACSDESVAAIRQAAVRGLGKLGDPTQIALVTERLCADLDPGVREVAAQTLGRLGSTSVHLEVLRERLDAKIEPATAVQMKAWEAYQAVFLRLPLTEQRAIVESWKSSDPATTAREIDLLVAMEKQAATAQIDVTRLGEIRERLGDALIAASRPADAAVVLARQAEIMTSDLAENQTRIALKLIESLLKSGAAEKIPGAAAGIQTPMARDAVAARLLRYVEQIAVHDGAAALVFLDRLGAAVPDQFGTSWATRFRKLRASIHAGSSPSTRATSD